MGLASVSVDLDSLPHYCRIHGLPESHLSAAARGLVYRVAVPRFLTLFAEHRLPFTLFAVGEDLGAAEARRVVRVAADAGAEISNHSGRHDYALSRRTPEEIRADVALGHRAVELAAGRAPVGFRAPGYTLSASLLAELETLGYRYDSSTFPSAPYYLAKAVVRAALRASGRPSASVLDSPAVLTAPLRPYRPASGQPYCSGGSGLWELPISVTPGLRLPFIGTFVVSLPRRLVSAAYRALRRAAHFTFEMHAVDLLDTADGIPPALTARQRDLCIPWELKRERLGSILARLAGDFEPLTLAAVTERLSGGGT